ncbi:MAG: hypothetical protein H5T86_04150 [Armatimonadetes bacterium]|nr:hypothetical protein [Armatimonadota bacterium]
MAGNLNTPGGTARPGRVPLWFAPALVAVICWLGGAHQPGPLSVYPASWRLPLVWYLLEQAVAVGATVAALGAGSALISGRVPPLRPVLSATCEARYALALAAALASETVLHNFIPARPVDVEDGGLKLTLSVGQWIWLVVMTLAVAGLMARAAIRYLSVLRLVVPEGWRVGAALIATVVLGEATARLIVSKLLGIVAWPPV